MESKVVLNLLGVLKAYFVSEMTYYVLSGTSNSTHSLGLLQRIIVFGDVVLYKFMFFSYAYLLGA